MRIVTVQFKTTKFKRLSSTEVTNMWSYFSSLPYVFMARCLV